VDVWELLREIEQSDCVVQDPIAPVVIVVSPSDDGEVLAERPVIALMQ
jgi:hypothetical protein